MTRYICLITTALMLLGCQKEKKEQDIISDAPLTISYAHYEQKTKLPCKGECTYVSIDVPVAENGSIAADSINKKVFNTVRNIVYFGEKPSGAKSYDGITASFIEAYDELVQKFPDEGLVQWEAKIKGTVSHKSDSLLNIKINNYMFTGGAHGYEGERSLLFDLSTGKSLEPAQLLRDIKNFTKIAETKFREKYKIPKGKSINATGMLFENEKFILPKNIFFNPQGILLYYNAYEIASYADGAKEVLIPYSVADDYLKFK